MGLVLNGGAATVSEAVAQVSDLLDGLACKLGRVSLPAERCTCLRETLGSCISEIHCEGILISETGVKLCPSSIDSLEPLMAASSSPHEALRSMLETNLHRTNRKEDLIKDTGMGLRNNQYHHVQLVAFKWVTA